MLPRRRLNYVCEMVEEIVIQLLLQLIVIVGHLESIKSRKRKRCLGRGPYAILARIPDQVKHMNRLVNVSDVDCIANLRMDRNTFGRLCHLLRQLGGLKDGRYVSIEEQVAMFLSVLAHHKKNRVVKFDFWRSGCTISTYVHAVLKVVLSLHILIFVRPQPVTDDCVDNRWRWFKGCLGALDGTYIDVKVSNEDRPRYRTRKGHISTNSLAVCDRYLKFVYVLPGWEGSAADSRILRDALNRPHRLRVPKENFYLVDNGYANCEGFLAPYKGVRYHLKEWGPVGARPQNSQELFNLRHAKARNTIEHVFGVMKMRWGILRSASYYPIKIQTRLIMACFVLHNFIRGEMLVDPIEEEFDDMLPETTEFEPEHEEFVDIVEPSPEWTAARDELARSMWQQYVAG